MNALPDHIVERISDTLTGQNMDPSVWNEAFIRIAIAAPHYAGSVEIAKALGISRSAEYRIRSKIIQEARRGRN